MLSLEEREWRKIYSESGPVRTGGSVQSVGWVDRFAVGGRYGFVGPGLSCWVGPNSLHDGVTLTGAFPIVCFRCMRCLAVTGSGWLRWRDGATRGMIDGGGLCEKFSSVCWW